MNRPAFHRSAPKGFTLMETLVLIGIIIVLLSIFIPYVQSIRETSRRMNCANNLRQVRNALQNYARDNGSDFPRVVYSAADNPDGYVAFTGPDAPNPFIENSPVQPNDVTASLWLLVRGAYVTDTRLFICPSSDDTRDLMSDASGQATARPVQRGNFRKPGNLSYSYADPFSSAPGFRLNDTKPSEFVLMADKNPGAEAANYPIDAPRKELAKANSPNHGRAGQNVLFANGSVSFVLTPFCGVGDDNIYTARASRPTTQAAELSPKVNGVVGLNVAPVRNDDSYLVPTATDPWPILAQARITVPPASAPTTVSPAPETTTTAPTSSTTVSTTIPATISTAPTSQ